MSEKDKGQFPRVTAEDIDFEINNARQIQYHIFPDTTMTVCAVTLANGFVVTGTAAAVSKENFDVDIGRDVSMDRVRDKLWELLGFAMKDRLWADGDRVDV